MQPTHTNADSTPRRRWPQFGLRHLFVLVLIAALVAAAATGTFGNTVQLGTWMLLGFVVVIVVHVGTALMVGFLLASVLLVIELSLRWLVNQVRGRPNRKRDPSGNTEMSRER